MITRQWLATQLACPEQVEVFVETFGEQVRVTRKNLLRAVRADISIEFLVNTTSSELYLEDDDFEAIERVLNRRTYKTFRNRQIAAARLYADHWGLK